MSKETKEINESRYSCFDKEQQLPLAAAIERVLRRTGDIAFAKLLLLEEMTRPGGKTLHRDGHLQFYELLASIELIHLAELGCADFQPKGTGQ